MKLKRWDIVEVKWVDSVHDSKWRFEDDADADIKDNELHHITVGYFFKQTKEQIAIAQSKSDDGEPQSNVDGLMRIPLVAVKKVIRIRS